MTDMQAAMGRVQLKRLDGFLRRRAELAAIYDNALGGLSLQLPAKLPGRVYHRYVLRLPGNLAELLLKSLNRRGIMARRPVFRPLHWDVPCSGKYPEADRAWAQCLSLPLYPLLKEGEQKRVIAETIMLCSK